MADTTNPMVAALLRERAGYLAQGKTDRAALVEEQLRLRGYEPPEAEAADVVPSTPPAEPATQAPRGRSGRPRHQTT